MKKKKCKIMMRTFYISGFTLIIFLLLINGCEDKIRSDCEADPMIRDINPCWSPEHSSIIYFHDAINESDTTGLYSVSLDSTEPVLLLSGLIGYPDWSPDGNKIAYSFNKAIWVTNIDTLEPVLFFENEDENFSYPDWSPDGCFLSFISAFSGLWIGELSTTGNPISKRLIRVESIGIPHWIDNNRLLCGSGEILMIDKDGNYIRQIFHEGGDAKISPNNEQIAFGIPDCGIWLIDTLGNNLRYITEGMSHAWSPDGEKLVFSKLTSQGIFLFLISKDGITESQLTFPEFYY